MTPSTFPVAASIRFSPSTASKICGRPGTQITAGASEHGAGEPRKYPSTLCQRSAPPAASTAVTAASEPGRLARYTTSPPTIARYGATPGAIPDVVASCDHTVAPEAASSAITRSPPPAPTKSTTRSPTTAGCDTGRRSVRDHPGACAHAGAAVIGQKDGGKGNGVVLPS